jgi:hypothetical protein
MKSTSSKSELVTTNFGLVEMVVMGDKVQSLPQTVEQKHMTSCSLWRVLAYI